MWNEEKSGWNSRYEIQRRKIDEPSAENGWDQSLLRSNENIKRQSLINPINPSQLLSAARAEFAVRWGYNILINNTLRNAGDVVTDAAGFRIRRSETN